MSPSAPQPPGPSRSTSVAPAPHGVGLAPTRTTLDNGVVVIAKRTRKTPAVSIHLGIRAGSVCDPVDASGSMSLLARVIDRGTARRSAAEIAEELDSRGVSLTTGVSRHLFSVVCTCLAADFDAVLDLVGDIVTAPVIPAAELEIRKGEAVTAIRQDDDNPAVVAVEGLMAALYGSRHPYGRRLKGTIGGVEAITRDDLIRLHAERFSPDALTVVVVGDVDVPRVMASSGRVFDGWRGSPATAVDIPRPPAALERRRIVVPMMNKAQVDIAYGFVTIRRSDPAYYAHWLMNNAFGEYALGGRLGDNIRERQGMAYYVFSRLDANVVEGPLVLRAGVSPSNVDRTIAAMDDELARLRAEGLTVEELNESRRYLTGAVPRALETNAGIADFLQSAEFWGLGLDYDERLPGLLAGVTLEEVNEAARRVANPERATVVIAGPYA
jgi:zinc protease